MQICTKKPIIISGDMTQSVKAEHIEKNQREIFYMKFFLKKFNKLWIVILNISLIFFSSYFIWHSEKIQERIAPKKFWERKINTLNSELKNDDIRIKYLKLDLEKEISLISYNEEKAKIKAQKENLDPTEVFHEIKNEYNNTINRLKEEIDELKKDEETVKNNLEKAHFQIKALN